MFLQAAFYKFPLLIFQSAFEKWGQNIKEFWTTLDYVAFWGWILIALSFIFIVLLILFTEFKRKDRDSIKFSSITIIVSSLLLGLGLHMVFTAAGLW